MQTATSGSSAATTDVITSAGYRIGPGEESKTTSCKHPAVKMVAVIGSPDPQRTEIVVAVIVLKDGVVGNDALKREIQEHVKVRLAAHEYPREIFFVDELPMTTTGQSDTARNCAPRRVSEWRAPGLRNQYCSEQSSDAAIRPAVLVSAARR